MLTIGEAMNNYSLIIRLVTQPKFNFIIQETGEVIPNVKVTVKQFFDKLDKIEAVDDGNLHYTRIYVNPFLKCCLIAGLVSTQDDDPVQFHELPVYMVETLYCLLKMSVSHGYRLGLDDVRRNIGTMVKTDDNNM